MQLTTEQKPKLSEREENFYKHYRLAFICMKAAIYNLSMARDFTHQDHRGLRRSLDLAQKAIESKYQDVALYLKSGYWRALQNDVNSDVILSIANVTNEFSTLGNLLDIEDEIIAKIKELGVPYTETELQEA